MSIIHKRVVLLAALLLPCLPATARATWSIIVLDKRTGYVGVAGASCVSDVYGIVTLFPGRGALIAQAIGHPPAVREAITLLRAGVAPDSVLRAITAPALDSATTSRQYAMAMLTLGQAQFSGSGLPAYSGERQSEGVLVQGGLLTGPEVLERTLEAIQRARAAGKPLEEVLLTGLRAGADAGGDSRCGAQRATAAFLTVAKPGDVPNWPYLTLRVIDAARGSDVNAVELLERRFAVWKANGGPRHRITSETVRPDSTSR